MAVSAGREDTGSVRRGGRISFGAVALVAIALILQVVLPTWVSSASLLNLPLLVAVYCMLASGSVISAMIFGTLIGWAHDGLTHGPLGAVGMVYAVLGYLCASTGRLVRLDIPLVLAVLVGSLYLAHEFLLFGIHEYLLDGQAVFAPGLWLFLAALHACAALLAYPLFDRLSGLR